MGKALMWAFVLALVIAPFLALSFFAVLLGFREFWLSLLLAILSAYLILSVFFLLRIFVFYSEKRLSGKRPKTDDFSKARISVGMTAYNDEGVIGKAVKDFLSHPGVEEVFVVDNNCRDNTVPEAKAAGAKIVREPIQGYGAAATRALVAALDSARKKNNLVLLVEGDQTYDAGDIDKFLSYIGNADMVVGTRTVKETAERDSQVTNLMHHANIFIAKFLELKYWDSLRISDVGCTMRMIRPSVLEDVLPALKIRGNSFSPHQIDMVLKKGYTVVEIPVHFTKRGGVSKGIGADFLKGFPTGLEMIWHILTE